MSTNETRQTTIEKKTVTASREGEEKGGSPGASRDTGAKTDMLAVLQHQVELYRQAFALIPAPDDPHPYTAYLEPSREDMTMLSVSCDCGAQEECRQIALLAEVVSERRKKSWMLPTYHELLYSFWYHLASALTEETKNDVRVVDVQMSDHKCSLLIYDNAGDLLIEYTGHSEEERQRLQERMGHPADNERFVALETLMESQKSRQEAEVAARGFTLRKKAVEHSVWYRLGYHVWREFGRDGIVFCPEVEASADAQTFALRGITPSGEEQFTLHLPNQHQQKIFKLLKGRFSSSKGTPQATASPICKARRLSEQQLQLQPQLRVTYHDDTVDYVDIDRMPSAMSGNVIKLKGIGSVLIQNDPDTDKLPDIERKTVLEGEEIPRFLQQYRDNFNASVWDVDEEVMSLRINEQPEELSLHTEAIDRDWCWMAVKYRFGNTYVNVADIARARQTQQRFVRTSDGWLDTEAADTEAVAEVYTGYGTETAKGQVKLPRMQLLKLAAVNDLPNVQLSAETAEAKEELDNLINLRPPDTSPDIEGLISPLRNYQETGLQWLKFLTDNRFGGLLCDEMGLGKTHQVMALMAAAKKEKNPAPPSLVVCPTTVLSHWQQKIQQHTSTLTPYMLHGGERDIAEAVTEADVLLTSYGVMRNDADVLSKYSFGLLVFDEIQNIKNSAAKTHRAALSLQADVTFGLTGTPIENRLTELKALFDVVLPRYLGGDQRFYQEFVQPIENKQDKKQHQKLHRMISPFTLRRTKTTVLEELPEKIEDVRYCELSGEQTDLYRQTVASRVPDLRKQLEDETQPVPYLHIFSFIDMLKQICDHPALLRGEPEAVETYSSGKWELFKEIVSECMAADEKIVVFSQYLTMLDMMERHLNSMGIDYAKLTGQTHDRGSVLSRFNNEPSCRVFLGSLKAGGTGIDLVGGSVVIHYDRWWNAAREEQATDRVHRIGQDKGVQVFKFITEGTLEEKIAAIIDKKKTLMNTLVTEDDPSVMKQFSRSELLDLLTTIPAGE